MNNISFPINFHNDKIDSDFTLYSLLNKDNMFFFQTDESVKVRIIKTYECQTTILNELQFFKTNTNYFVNPEYVVRIFNHNNKYLCEMINGELLPILKSRKKEIQKLLNFPVK